MGVQGIRVGRQLPYSLLATAIVVVLPAILVALVPGSPGPLIGIPLCVALSLGFARLAAAVWRRSPRSREVLFADLMLWGWVRRVATERRLAQAHNLVEDASGDADQRVRALERVSAMLESRDAYTRKHSLRVTRYSEAIARGLDLPEPEVAQVRKAAALHDVGKFFTPREVLNKPGRLTEWEFGVIKRHPGQGADLLRGVVEPEVVAMIRHHHERLGGAGYPDGLVGDAIPLGARIIAVADTFDAITSTRPYRHASAHKKALDILGAGAGTQLDPDAVRAFGSCYSGRRPLAYWTILAHGRPRLASLLGGGLSTASAGTMANVMTTAAAAAAVGGIALGQLVKAPAESPRALVEAGKSPASSQTRSRPQASRRGDPPSPFDRPGSRRDRGPSPTRSATPMPAFTTVPAQGSGDRRRPTAPHPIPANGSEPAATPLPANQPTQGNGEKKDKARGGEKDAGHDDKGPTRDKDRDPDKTKGKAHGRDKGRGPDSGRGPDKGPRPDKDRGPDNGKGKDQGPAGNPTPGSSPGHGQGDGDSLGEPPHTRPKT